MPLNSQHLPKDVRNYLRELPLDKECVDDRMYQTKVELFEKHCRGCGFVRIKVMTLGGDDRQRVHTFEGENAIEKATNAMGVNRCETIRMCTYPQDITVKNDEEEYPTLNEIVSNTCQFWHLEKQNIFPDEETAFIEVEEIKMESVVDNRATNIISEGVSQK